MAPDDQLRFDERTAQRLELMYQTPDVLRRRRLVLEALEPRAGERILDLGCGPGFYVSDLLPVVGTQGAVSGVDNSEPMLAIARGRCEGQANADFFEGDATKIPAGDADFDAALSVQVFEYVDDIPQALRELYRVVRPGGRVVIWDTDWTTISWHSSDADRMRRVLAAWDEHLVHTSLPRVLGAQMRGAGWGNVGVEGHNFVNADLTPDAFSASLMNLMTTFVSPRIGAEVAEAWADDLRKLGERGDYFFSCTQFCFTADKPA